MADFLAGVYGAIAGRDDETPRVVEFARAAIAGVPRGVIVDVGCGYGRTLRALRAAGVDAVGVEVNASIVASNRRDGLRCMEPAEFMREPLEADAMVMSHLVEHFEPSRLVAFMDEYLDRLKPGGHLIVATPLLHARFYDDFDHVKPYHPTGFSMVFGAGSAQVQYYARNRLLPVDLWIRRGPFAFAFVRGLQIKSASTRAWQAANFLLALLFLASGGLLGRATGWVGVFRKEESRNQPGGVGR